MSVEVTPPVAMLGGMALTSIGSDIFQFPFRFNPGTIEESVGMSLDLSTESWDS